MRAAVESPARGLAAAGPRLDGQMKAGTRALLAGDSPRPTSPAPWGVWGRARPCACWLSCPAAMSSVPHAPSPELAPGPVRDLLLALVATLPVVDADTRPRPRARDRGLEERDEALSGRRSGPGNWRRCRARPASQQGETFIREINVRPGPPFGGAARYTVR